MHEETAGVFFLAKNKNNLFKKIDFQFCDEA
jgi:hypothetical protein